MKENRLAVRINKPLSVVFQFCITPPNSIKWIPGIIKEETSSWPIKKGTIYFLTNEKNETSQVIVINIIENEYIEWVTNNNYHCSYSLKLINANSTELLYSEWVDEGEIDGPFTQEILDKLKEVIEKNL